MGNFESTSPSQYCDFSQVWTYAGLGHIFTVYVNSFAYQSYCNWKMVLWSQLWPLTLPYRLLNLKWRNLMKTSHLELSAPQFLIHHISQLWFLVLVLVYSKKKLLWWGLNNAMLFGYRHMSLIVILLLCPLAESHNMLCPSAHDLSCLSVWTL